MLIFPQYRIKRIAELNEVFTPEELLTILNVFCMLNSLVTKWLCTFKPNILRVNIILYNGSTCDDRDVQPEVTSSVDSSTIFWLDLTISQPVNQDVHQFETFQLRSHKSIVSLRSINNQKYWITSVQAVLLVHLFVLSILSNPWPTVMLADPLVGTVHQAHVLVSVPILLCTWLTRTRLDATRLNFTLELHLLLFPRKRANETERETRKRGWSEETNKRGQRYERATREKSSEDLAVALYDDVSGDVSSRPLVRFRLLIARTVWGLRCFKPAYRRQSWFIQIDPSLSR